MRRVVVTGMSGVSPLGNSWGEISSRFEQGKSGVRSFPEWSEYQGLRTRLAGVVELRAGEAEYDRRRMRSLSNTALYSVYASQMALRQAGLEGAPVLTSGRVGVAYGSCLGGPEDLMNLAAAWKAKSLKGILASSYLKVMSHSCAANIALFFGLKGRVIPTCSACTSGSQAIGYAYEAIRYGLQDIFIAGGAEELCLGITGLFDAMGATSTSNDLNPPSPRPFDSQRDGLVLSEGACSFVLEERESAISRGADILAEVIGFGTNCDGSHITNPLPDQMEIAMRLALEDAKVDASEIDFVHAHATATELGDIAESVATCRVFGPTVRVTATKGWQGHTLGAAGALESWASVQFMNEGRIAPLCNFQELDPRCAELDYVTGEFRHGNYDRCMVNNFAFGGVNTSLIFGKHGV